MNNPSDKENFETELISESFYSCDNFKQFLEYLLVSYFDIVRKNVKDTVPKSIIHFLVNSSKDTIQNELVAALYKEELFDELLSESTVIAQVRHTLFIPSEMCFQRREACKIMMDILKKAHEILNEVEIFKLTKIELVLWKTSM